MEEGRKKGKIHVLLAAKHKNPDAGERLKGNGEQGSRGRDGQIASVIQWM